jgi:hypothetical protein
MKLKLLIIPALMTTALLAQGPGGPGGPRRAAASTHTPPTAAQMAANELTMIARYLKLDSAQTSSLTGNSALVTDIEAEQAGLTSAGTALKTAYGNLATAVSGGTSPTAAETAIATASASSLAARVAAAGQVLTALKGLGITLTTAQETGVAQLLIRGGGFGGGFGGPRGGFGPPPATTTP